MSIFTTLPNPTSDFVIDILPVPKIELPCTVLIFVPLTNMSCLLFHVDFSVSVTNLYDDDCVIFAGLVVSMFTTLPNPTSDFVRVVYDKLPLPSFFNHPKESGKFPKVVNIVFSS